MKKKVYTASVGFSYCIIEIKKKDKLKTNIKICNFKTKAIPYFFFKKNQCLSKELAFGLKGFLSLVYPFFSKVKP